MAISTITFRDALLIIGPLNFQGFEWKDDNAGQAGKSSKWGWVAYQPDSQMEVGLTHLLLSYEHMGGSPPPSPASYHGTLKHMPEFWGSCRPSVAICSHAVVLQIGQSWGR